MAAVLSVVVRSYPALLNAYADVCRRITAAIAEQAGGKAATAKVLAAPPSPIINASPPDADVEARVRVVAGYHLSDGPGGLGRAGRNHHREAQMVANASQVDVQVDHHLLAAAIQTQVEGLFEMEKHNIDLLQVR